MILPSPVIVVLAGDCGIGLGICKRLLHQLSFARPPDAELQRPELMPLDPQDMVEFMLAYEGVTLVLACRSVTDAEAARTTLYQYLDEELDRRRRAGNLESHALDFRRNVAIDITNIDLADVKTVFKAADELKRKYRYISHLLCNASSPRAENADWWTVVKHIMSNPSRILAAGELGVQASGPTDERSVDGLGTVWQSQVFSQYVLYKSLRSLLEACNRTRLGPARVLWTSTLEASPMGYDPEDWQLLKANDRSILAAFQVELLGSRLDLQASLQEDASIRHIVFHPGICDARISQSMLHPLKSLGVKMALHTARWLGNQHCTIDPYTAALAPVHMSLVPIFILPVYRATSASPYMAGPLNRLPPADGVTPSSSLQPVRYGTETDRLGRERLGMTEVYRWNAFADASEDLLCKFETLADDLRTKYVD